MVSDPQRSGELAERLMAMGRQLKRVAPNAARGVPVAEAATYLGVSEPTVRLWVRRGALASLPGSKPVLIEHET
ncbi:MAG TPA: helix-turn-helix domain-containing protein [Solirubrobacteraceae bacterium]